MGKGNWKLELPSIIAPQFLRARINASLLVHCGCKTSLFGAAITLDEILLSFTMINFCSLNIKSSSPLASGVNLLPSCFFPVCIEVKASFLFGLFVKPVDTPLETSDKRKPNEGELLQDQSKYRKIVKKLSYCHKTRPFVCCKCGKSLYAKS